MQESQDLFEGSQVNKPASDKRKRKPIQKHSPYCNCKLIPESAFESFRASWKVAKTYSEKCSLISSLIRRRFHGPKQDKVEYELNNQYIYFQNIVNNKRKL